MFNKVFQKESSIKFSVLLIAIFSIFINACGSKEGSQTETKNADSIVASPKSGSDIAVKAENESSVPNGALIDIKENSPADTVKVFYERLRQKKFRDAIVLTNLRPAIEGLSESELNELGVDFGFLAQSVPENMPINGEIISGDKATVTVKLPNEEDGKIEVQEIKLRKEKDSWIVLVADPEGEKDVKKEGKNYFFVMRMNVHHAEAKTMLSRINKAQLAYSMKNDGRFTDLRTLVEKGFVPRDALGSITTGYKYDIALAEDNTLYTALATPAEYGKTGKLSFAYKISRDKQPELIAKDVKGKSLQN